MKRMKRLLSLLLTAGMLVSILFSVSAQAAEVGARQTTYTKFDYVIYAADGTVIDRGTTPDFRNRLDWSGIVLTNGQSTTFAPAGQSDFEVFPNSQVKFSYSLDRYAKMYHAILKRVNTSLETVNSLSISSVGSQIGASVKEYGRYVFYIQNQSSDPVTLTRVTVSF